MSCMKGDDPSGIRTRVAAVKGRCPGPLDDGAKRADVVPIAQEREQYADGSAGVNRAESVQQPAISPRQAEACRRCGGPLFVSSLLLVALAADIPDICRRMLHYFKFRHDLFSPQPAKEIYVKRGAGKGWPEECPPIRGANAFGFDVLANFDVTFIKSRTGDWRVADDVVIESDFHYAGSDESDGAPLHQQYAWFWERGQKLPHVITDNVYAEIRNQVKVSSFLFLKTDPNELLLITDIPKL